MIDVYARTNTFADKAKLIVDLTAAIMKWEGVPPIPLFKDNTAAFIHDMDPGSFGNANGMADRVRVQVLTPLGVLNREKQIGVVADMTAIIAEAAGDPALRERTWVLLVESPDGGWGIGGHANTNDDIKALALKALGKA